VAVEDTVLMKLVEQAALAAAEALAVAVTQRLEAQVQQVKAMMAVADIQPLLIEVQAVAVVQVPKEAKAHPTVKLVLTAVMV
jgi:hypothetical protein